MRGCLVQFFPVMLGDMDNSGSLNAQIIHQISNRVRSKLAETQLVERGKGVKMGRGTDRYRNTHTYTSDRVGYSNSGVECWPQLILTSKAPPQICVRMSHTRFCLQ